MIKSDRKDDYAYRVYDETAIRQIQQIIILRKLQIPVSQIRDILRNQNAVEVINIFKQNIEELDERVAALSTIKSILIRFFDEMQEKADIHLTLDILNDKTTFAVVSALSFSENKIKENLSMEDLNKASETLSNLEEKKISETIGPEQTQIKANHPTLEKFEIVKCGPYRFIGKAVFVRNDWGNPYIQPPHVQGQLWKAKNWIFDTLDKMTEYTTEMPYAASLYTWERYDEKNQLQGYIIGKFMKEDCPIPNGMDYYDIPEGYIAKGWKESKGHPIEWCEDSVHKAIANSKEYAAASYIWGGDVFSDPEMLTVDGPCGVSGYFIWCTLK